MIKNVLPVAESPLIGFLRWPYTLAITNIYPKTLPWFYSNFIQVHVNKHFIKNRTQCNFNFFRGGRWELNNNNPYIISNTLHNNILRSLCNDIVTFVTNSIDSGYYVVAFVDEYEISHKAAYQNHHLPHHIMVYGYDRDKKMFNTLGFDHRENFGKYDVSFTEFENAYRAVNQLVEQGKFRDHPDESTFLLKFNADFDYSFNKEVVLQQLKEYIDSTTTIDLMNYSYSNSAFGLDTYDYLISFYQELMSNGSLNRTGTLRHLHILWEHKKIMTKRIEYMMDSGFLIKNDQIIEKLNKIEKQAMTLRNLLIKYTITHKPEVLQKVTNLLSEMKKDEEIVYQEILDTNTIGEIYKSSI